MAFPIIAIPRAPPPLVRAQPALECGSLLPLSPSRTCSRECQPRAQFPASKLAGDKAAASCRTPKLRTSAKTVVAPGACPASARSATVVNSQNRRSSRHKSSGQVDRRYRSGFSHRLWRGRTCVRSTRRLTGWVIGWASLSAGSYLRLLTVGPCRGLPTMRRFGWTAQNGNGG